MGNSERTKNGFLRDRSVKRKTVLSHCAQLLMMMMMKMMMIIVMIMIMIIITIIIIIIIITKIIITINSITSIALLTYK